MLLSDNVWATRAFSLLETLVVPLASWFKPVCVAFALLWYGHSNLLVSTCIGEANASLRSGSFTARPASSLLQ